MDNGTISNNIVTRSDGGYTSIPIYKMDTKGNIRVWRIEVSGDSYRVHTSILDGKVITSAWKKCAPKSRDTAEAQALFEAKSKLKKKLDREYFEDLEDAVRGTPKMFLCSRPVSLAEVDETKIPFPCEAQPKLDGVRCHINVDGAWTRENQPILSVSHILTALKPFFKVFPKARLDGELYGHTMVGKLQEISSMVRKQTPTHEQNAYCAKHIQIHVFDTPLTGNTTTERLSEYKVWFDVNPTEHVEFVETIRVTSMDELYAYHEENLVKGMEGTILRIDAPYTPKKTKNILKVKDFTCAEFKIKRIEEGVGNWAGMAKRVIYEFNDGDEFGTGIRGSREEMRKLYLERDEWVGSDGTVRYFGLTNTGRPNLAVTVCMYKGGRKD